MRHCMRTVVMFVWLDILNYVNSKCSLSLSLSLSLNSVSVRV
ncbi:MAG: hypothetical protein N7Q72_05245 [Spiroplasma sp. Tabriz.8]|nr:hypothetical protein [Spiroplasma sp. Tabriz.8]